MARGGPDWDAPDYQIATAKMDTGEIASYLFGTSTLDGTGRLYIMQNFGNGFLSETRSSAGDGSQPTLERGITPLSGIRLALVAGTLTGGGASSFTGYSHFPNPGRVGFNIGILHYRYKPDSFIHIAYWRDGYLYRGRIWFDAWEHKVYLESPSGAYVEVPGVFPSVLITERLTHIKLVADFVTGYYHRLLVGSDTFDLSDYALAKDTTREEGILTYGLECKAWTGPAQTGHCCYYLVTVDEP